MATCVPEIVIGAIRAETGRKGGKWGYQLENSRERGADGLSGEELHHPELVFLACNGIGDIIHNELDNMHPQTAAVAALEILLHVDNRKAVRIEALATVGQDDHKLVVGSGDLYSEPLARVVGIRVLDDIGARLINCKRQAERGLAVEAELHRLILDNLPDMMQLIRASRNKLFKSYCVLAFALHG